VKPAQKNPAIIWNGSSIVIKLKSPPKDGAANKELRDRLADFFDIPKGKINILSGATSHNKRVIIDLDETTILKKLSTINANK
jgi:hypothetical protein